jgi:DNA-binding MarR family transcriptional regulator
MEKDLRHLLDELRAAIHRTRDGDEERAELNRLADAVERRLNEGTDEEEHHGLIEKLEEATLRFEVVHPTLGEAILRAVDALSAAGI